MKWVDSKKNGPFARDRRPTSGRRFIAYANRDFYNCSIPDLNLLICLQSSLGKLYKVGLIPGAKVTLALIWVIQFS